MRTRAHYNQEEVDDRHLRVKKAFAALRKQGIYTRQNFWCCQTCAGAALGQYFGTPKGLKWRGYAYWHQQDNVHARTGEAFYLAFGTTKDGDEEAGSKVGADVVAALRAEGVSVSWDGSKHTRICIDEAVARYVAQGVAI